MGEERKAMFRVLRADEIDCRVNTVKPPKDGKQGYITLLLYKDARCDMTILDETVGPMFWQREHSRDNANCKVSLYSKELGQWVSKEDVGTPSNTEAQKGLASDSFKRACTNWGIGRELYTAPDIYIFGNPDALKYDRYLVTEIGYLEETRVINKLVIVSKKTGKVVFDMKHPVNPDIVEPEITPQNVVKAEDKKGSQKPQNKPEQAPAPVANVEVTTQATVPALSPEMLYLQAALEKFNNDFGGDDEKHSKFNRMRKVLIVEKSLPDKKLSVLTKDEIDRMMSRIYETFASERVAS